MMTKTKVRFCVAVLAVLQSCCFAGTIPQPVAEGVQRLESFYAEGASTISWVQLMVIPPGIFVDPPPTAAKFPSRANLMFGVDAPTAHSFVKAVIADIRSSKWKQAPAPGYPRWYWRLVDESGDVVMELLIDEENAAIGYAGAWYAVDRNLVKRLTRDFIEFSTKQLLVPDRKNP